MTTFPTSQPANIVAVCWFFLLSALFFWVQTQSRRHRLGNIKLGVGHPGGRDHPTWTWDLSGCRGHTQDMEAERPRHWITERICGHTVCSYWGIRHNERRRFRRFTLIADGCVCASCLKVLVGSLFRNEVCFPGQTSTWRQRKPERRRADRPEAADRRWPVKHKWHTGSTLTAYLLLAELSRKYGTIKSQFMIHS